MPLSHLTSPFTPSAEPTQHTDSPLTMNPLKVGQANENVNHDSSPKSHRTSSGWWGEPSHGHLKSKHILVKATVWLEPLHQDLHFLHLAEGQVRDDTEQALQHTRVGANEGAVDLVQEHHKLIFVTRQQEVALQQKRGQKAQKQGQGFGQPVSEPQRSPTSIRSCPRKTVPVLPGD